MSYLVQLIWAGANGVADPVTNTTTTGVSGDDQVVASAWMGLNVPNPIRLGKFTSGSTPYNNTHADGQELYIRAWEQPDNGASNGIPVSLAAGTRHGNSTLHAITDFTSGNPESFEAGGSQPSWFQIVAIPEPGTCAFLAAGLVLMLSRRMIQRWRN
ncbi:MAG: hypothetical protein NTY53_20595 [Kiritimatiellaeota bacterium]|nr:hypothetical protein [Kiritimatiellota bacterium]